MKRLGLGLLLVAATTTSSNAATTAEPRLQRSFMYPAAICQSIGQPVEYSQFGVYNLGGVFATVVCPLSFSQTRLPHSATSPFGSPGVLIKEALYSVEVVVYDRSDIYSVSCQVHNVDMAGNTIWSQGKFTSASMSSLFPMTLTFSAVSGSLLENGFYLACSMPPMSRLYPNDPSIVTSIKVNVEQPVP
jgi:hypothetical protein